MSEWLNQYHPFAPTTVPSLETAICYDIETLVNCFTLNVHGLFSDLKATFEVSEYRDDRQFISAWLEYWRANQILMIGFNNLNFDQPVLQFIYDNPSATYQHIFDKAQDQIHDRTIFKTVRPKDRFAPQCDLFKLNHFDNRAKMTSLKALQVNMRSETVLEMPLPWDKPIAAIDIENVLIPYNDHDTAETKKFALFNLEAIKFRLSLVEQFGIDVLNYNDGKIGRSIIQKRLGDDVCYSWENGTREPRQTPRETISLNDIIFPYIRFTNPEFARVLAWMRTQTLTGNEVTGNLETKGVFSGVKAHVGGIDFHFGTGGIHGSVSSQVFAADAEWMVVDIDVKQLYPNIAIKNRLYPEHLGEGFVEVYASIPAEREEWQKKKGKKCIEANTMKLASNVPYGDSNNQYSFMYDPRFTMSITINGQLMLCMLAEWLLTVPTLQIISINTDGITYRIRREHNAKAIEVRAAWQAYTRLTLEDVEYERVWARDVNSFLAKPVDGLLKQKGALWFPVRFPEDISESQPPAWHKDLSNIVSTMAAVEHMTKGVDIERFIYGCSDPFLFMLRQKVDRSMKLFIGDVETQRMLRYYIATDGAPLRKVMPPKGPAGQFKRKNGISNHEYHSILQTLSPGTHDPRIHTANKSRYEQREQGLQSGYLVADCCRASDFDFGRVNYDWYVREAEKLVIN